MSDQSQGELYRYAKHLQTLVPTNETEDNNFVPYRSILDEARAEFPRDAEDALNWFTK